ncbi:MAG TPA: MATE family efflux transporter [Hyphomonadaceae bacterium]|nr:MATE family efflux transporter [Hyphomonadaceae bacterium]
MDAIAPTVETATPLKTPPPLWRSFLIFLAPMMLSNVLQSLSGTINSVFLGQMIGVKAIAAATVFFPVMFFFISFVMGLGTGATVLIGQAFGRKDMERVRAVAGSVLALAISIGLFIAIVGGAFAGHLMAALQTPADIIEDATNYARIMMITMPVFFVFILSTSILRGVGDAVTPLWVLVVSTSVGLLITPAFIAGWFGLPKLGVASAAVASLISLVAAMAFLAWRLLRKKHPLAPDKALLKHMTFEPKVLTNVLRIGVPTAVQMVIMAIAEIVLLGLANSYGSGATAAYGAINQILAYVQFPAMSIGITASILGAQAIGAGRIAQLWPITKTALMMNTVITGAGVLLVYLISGPVVAMFIKDVEIAELTQHLLHIVLWSTVVFGFAVVFSSMMRSSGTVLAPTAIGILAILLVEVPTGVFLSKQIGIDGVWWAYPAAFSAMFVMQGAFYSLVWRRKSIVAIA